MPSRLLLNIPEMETQTTALQNLFCNMKETGEKYKRITEAMASGWSGSSGRSFAESAGRVQGGYMIICMSLQQLIYDATTARRAIMDQDTLTSTIVDSMDIEE